jgi:hypothetical protein
MMNQTTAAAGGVLLGVGMGYMLFKAPVRAAVAASRQCAVGDKLPAVALFEGTPKTSVSLPELFGDKKAIVFGLPGAFTPG